ncbi:MAG: hypothetical protein ACKOQP_00135, partial [Bacteroidota bacterium]
MGFRRLQLLEITTSKLTVAQKINAIATGVATTAWKSLSAALTSNPIGLILTALSVALPFLIDFGNETEELVDNQNELIDSTRALADVQQKSNDLIAKEKVELDGLFERLKKTNANSKERKQLIDQINSTYGTTLQNLKDEKKFQEQVNIEYAKAIRLIEAKAKRQAIEEELVELYKQERKIQQDIEKANVSIANSQDKINKGGLATEERNQLILNKGKEIFERLTNVEKLATTTEAINKLKGQYVDLEKTLTPTVVPSVPVTVRPTVDKDKFLDDLKKELAKLETELATSSIEIRDVVSLEGELQKIDDLKNQTLKTIGETTDARIAERQKEKKLTFEELTTLLEIELDQKILAERKANQEKNKITKQYNEERLATIKQISDAEAQLQLAIFTKLNDDILADNERIDNELAKTTNKGRIQELLKFQQQNRATLESNYQFERYLLLKQSETER